MIDAEFQSRSIRVQQTKILGHIVIFKHFNRHIHKIKLQYIEVWMKSTTKVLNKFIDVQYT